MNCPKCGHDNPEGTLFCEECDWRMDQKVGFGGSSFDKSSIIVYTAFLSAALGIAAIISTFIAGGGWFAVAFGAVGMALSGYSQTAVRIIDLKGKVKMSLILVDGIGIITSVIGFIYGLYVALL